MAEEEGATWMMLADAADALRLNIAALRKRVRRGDWEAAGLARHDASHRLWVLVSAADVIGHGLTRRDQEATITLLRAELKREREVCDTLRRALRDIQAQHPA